MSQSEEKKTGTRERDLKTVAADHAALRQMFGLDKAAAERGRGEQPEKEKWGRAVVSIVVAVAVVAGCVGMYFWGARTIERHEEAQYVAEQQRKLALEEERRNRIEYAEIAFLDSFPPTVDISMDGKKQYARVPDGSYTELRARESTWIRNLPIKEDTVVRFGFEAEGFRPLTREVAYYDWFPSDKPTGSSLKKVFRKIVLEPDVTPKVAGCEQLPKVEDADPCEWTVFREIVFRERYAETVGMVMATEPQKRQAVKSLIMRQPLFGQVARGLDVEVLDTKKPLPLPEWPDITRTLYKNLSEHPYSLYGSITLETDSPDTRVFFMGEPLMVVKESGSMTQVRIQPGEPYTFAVYGQGRPVVITDKLSLRLETNDAPAYVTEIQPYQWHCSVPDIEEALKVPAPEIPADLNSTDFRHYLCLYNVKLSVKFEEIKALDAMTESQKTH